MIEWPLLSFAACPHRFFRTGLQKIYFSENYCLVPILAILILFGNIFLLPLRFPILQKLKSKDGYIPHFIYNDYHLKFILIWLMLSLEV
jgi:hypothetical protein